MRGFSRLRETRPRHLIDRLKTSDWLPDAVTTLSMTAAGWQFALHAE
jgi:hypothetical protein